MIKNFWEPNTFPVIPKKQRVTSYWAVPDTRENFLKNPKPGYTETSIVYRYNRHGFRTHEFNKNSPKPSILCLGCSFTEGIGVAAEHAWPSLIEQHFPTHQVYNLGIAGSSGDAVPRLLTNLGQMLHTEFVFVLWTDLFRYETYYDDQIDSNTNNPSAWTPYMLTDEHMYNVRQRNRAMVNMLSAIHRYTVIEHSIMETNWPADFGRDDHPGPQWHSGQAQYFLKKLEEIQSQNPTVGN